MVAGARSAGLQRYYRRGQVEMAQSNSAPLHATEAAAEDSFLTLRITLGATRFPVRPVLKDRFTLGSGAACDLRLGAEFPKLFAVIVVAAPEVLLEQLAPSPALCVNGQPTQSAVLETGDRIRLGGIELEAIIPAATRLSFPSPLLGRVVETVSAEEAAVFDAAELSELSAADLVNLIEQEERVAERDQAGRDLGAESLLFEVRRRHQIARTNTIHAPGKGPIGPHWNLARIPLQRVLDTAARRASGEADLIQRIDALQLEVTRLSRQIEHSTRAGSGSDESRPSATETLRLVKERGQLVGELNALFDQVGGESRLATA
jgi:hypothetical protein